MYISRRDSLAFLAHPRTASRSVAAALKTLGFTPHRGHHGGPLIGVGKYEDLSYFCTVRNHWDVFASWWINSTAVQKEGSIKKDWIKAWVERHTRKHPFYCRPHRLFFFLSDIPETVPLYFERLDEELDHFLIMHNLPEVELPHISEKRRKKRDYRPLYTDEARDFVEEYFAEETEALGYSFVEGGPHAPPSIPDRVLFPLLPLSPHKSDRLPDD